MMQKVLGKYMAFIHHKTNRLWISVICSKHRQTQTQTPTHKHRFLNYNMTKMRQLSSIAMLLWEQNNLERKSTNPSVVRKCSQDGEIIIFTWQQLSVTAAENVLIYPWFHSTSALCNQEYTKKIPNPHCYWFLGQAHTSEPYQTDQSNEYPAIYRVLKKRAN